MSVGRVCSHELCCVMTLLNRSSAILGLGTVQAKNEHEEEGVGEEVSTRATAKPTNPSTTAAPPTAPAPGLGP